MFQSTTTWRASWLNIWSNSERRRRWWSLRIFTSSSLIWMIARDVGWMRMWGRQASVVEFLLGTFYAFLSINIEITRRKLVKIATYPNKTQIQKHQKKVFEDKWSACFECSKYVSSYLHWKNSVWIPIYEKHSKDEGNKMNVFKFKFFPQKFSVINIF